MWNVQPLSWQIVLIFFLLGPSAWNGRGSPSERYDSGHLYRSTSRKINAWMIFAIFTVLLCWLNQLGDSCSLPLLSCERLSSVTRNALSALLQFTRFPNAFQLFCLQGNVRASFRRQRIKTSVIPCKRSCWRNAYSHYGTLGMLSLSGHGFLYDQLVRMKCLVYFVCALVQSCYRCLPRIRAFFVQISRIANPNFSLVFLIRLFLPSFPLTLWFNALYFLEKQM